MALIIQGTVKFRLLGFTLWTVPVNGRVVLPAEWTAAGMFLPGAKLWSINERGVNLTLALVLPGQVI